MPFSMTGYGQSSFSHSGYKLRIEVKSVNHRYCEVVMRVPRDWMRFEENLRSIVRSRLKRGRIDVYLTVDTDSEACESVALDSKLVDAYIRAAEELKLRYGIEGRLSVNDILSFSNIIVHHHLSSAVIEEEAMMWQNKLQRGMEDALDQLQQMRLREGLYLISDIEHRINRLDCFRLRMEKMAMCVVSNYRDKLKQRLHELHENCVVFDEYKFGMEVALFAERSNIDEELTRFHSHLNQCRDLLNCSEPFGRKLDFLVQEMNREINTIGAKANDIALVSSVVEVKAELEKIREQAMNVE